MQKWKWKWDKEIRKKIVKWDWQSSVMQKKKKKDEGQSLKEYVREREIGKQIERELEIEWDIECVIRRGIDRDRGIKTKRSQKKYERKRVCEREIIKRRFW